MLTARRATDEKGMQFMWVLVYYYCRENGERRIVSAATYDSLTEARCDFRDSVEKFRGSLKEKIVLHDHGGDNWWQIDIRSGYNEFYTWEILKV